MSEFDYGCKKHTGSYLFYNFDPDKWLDYSLECWTRREDGVCHDILGYYLDYCLREIKESKNPNIQEKLNILDQAIIAFICRDIKTCEQLLVQLGFVDPEETDKKPYLCNIDRCPQRQD